MKIRRRTLFRKIFLSFILPLFGLLAIFYVYSRMSFQDFFLQHTRDSLREKMSLIELRIKNPQTDWNKENLQTLIQDFGKLAKVRVTLIDPKGNVLAENFTQPDSMGNHLNRPEVQMALRQGEGHASRFSNTLGEEHFYLAKLLKQNNVVTAILRLSVPVASIKRSIAKPFIDMRRAVLALTFFGVFLIWMLARRLSVPLEKMRGYALRIRENSLLAPIEISEHDSEEVRALGQSLNDMTEQLNVQINKISAQRNEREAIFSSMSEGVLTVDLNNNIFHWNRALCNLFEIPFATDFKGKPLIEVFKSEKLERIARTILKNGSVEEELIVGQGVIDRHPKVLQLVGGTLQDADGVKMGALLVFYDITRVRELEGHRKDFVANVGHELRTPLTSILGYIETLIDGDISVQDQERFLKVVHKHTLRLKQIIDDLMALSKLEKDPRSLRDEFELCDAGTLWDGPLEILKNKSLEREIRITKDFQYQGKIWCHPGMLEQALVNILDNAIKYGPAKEEVLLITRLEGANVFLGIEDKGPGIPESERERIFERFYSIDKARSRDSGGSGLGLSIVKHIAIMHGGKAGVLPSSDHGSIFFISIPSKALV